MWERHRGGTRRTAILTHNFLAILCHIHTQCLTWHLFYFLARGGSERSPRLTGTLHASWLPDRDSETDCKTDRYCCGVCIYYFAKTNYFRLSTHITCFRLSACVICLRLLIQVHPAREISDWRPSQRLICNTRRLLGRVWASRWGI